MTLSVIVPTHERPDALASCLLTLQQQHVSPRDVEVIVVDDGSHTDIAAVVAAASERGPISMRCERQDMSGLNSARNRGVDVARGETLAFLDDDTLVSPDWARTLLDAFARLPCAAVGGRVELGLPGPAPQWLAEVDCYLARYDLGEEPRWIEGEPVPVGANCAVRRSEYERIGGFAPGLDRIGTSLISNGDTEFFRRLRAAGGRLRYEPQASVVHCVPADRLTTGFFVRRHRSQAASDELLLRLEGHRPTIGHRVGLGREVVTAARAAAGDVLRRRDPTLSWFLVHYWSARFSAAGGFSARTRRS